MNDVHIFTYKYELDSITGVALEVFNKCIQVSKKDGDDVITLNYDLLDDTYAIWSTETKVNFDATTGIFTDPSFLYMLVKDGKSYSNDVELDKKKNHPLAIMASSHLIILDIAFLLKSTHAFERFVNNLHRTEVGT